eukprot:TRINITY_DN22550_c0_g1_i1.p1 TRINITY_DN22550_c0_g1~~TRINITY_DN22550_c0_g1_i1.p1  ORF type:complete len:635 (+),score=225.30 TRINITY_DN22550_c0_g1_i1:73-1905(+)
MAPAAAGERLRVLLGHLPEAAQRTCSCHAEPDGGRPDPEVLPSAGGCPMDPLASRGQRVLAELESSMKRKPSKRSGPYRGPKPPKPANEVRGRFKPFVEPLLQLDALEDLTKDLGYNIAHHLPGPLRDTSRAFYDVLKEVRGAENAGASHLMWLRMQERYCSDGYASNFVVPIIGFRSDRPPCITQMIILAHPGDCKRIAARHVRKQPNFKSGLLGSSVISTTDNDHWKEQREQLIPAFHPMASLANIFPRVVKRARWSVDELMRVSDGGSKPVDISDFMLHEAFAQLMLGLWGMPEDFMNAINRRFRKTMTWDNKEPFFTRNLMEALLHMAKDPAHKSPTEALASGCPVHGPLSRAIDTTTPDDDNYTKLGNAFIFAFAGHDTTGHTMTWMVFEMAKRPDLQRRLQEEIDGFFARLGGREMEYRDLSELRFLTRCIMETLRLWPSVPNGTFRETEEDDWVHGTGGARVHVPKGTYVQVVTYPRHRDPELWGPDAHVFNPDRNFQGREIWDERGFAGFNPATERFSPFTFQPRDCIGKNFAQSEMRAILTHVFRRFNFELCNPEAEKEQRGVNYGTMGPRDFTRPAPEKPGFMNRVPVGLYVRAIPRQGQ